MLHVRQLALIGHDVVNEMAGTLWFGFSDVYGLSNFEARVVGLTSKIKVVDNIARAPRDLADQILFGSTLYY
jgi:hypothetical protein